ncbi:MAG: hypothetical protein MPK62_00505 [Alphaproteobacteria bacterium]|nr:hypothetical protein [Alphaproteobacteria bacterium]MDA8029619.1 hypothetical protein [Alphaproteobacteria bacterium]
MTENPVWIMDGNVWINDQHVDVEFLVEEAGDARCIEIHGRGISVKVRVDDVLKILDHQRAEWGSGR